MPIEYTTSKGEKVFIPESIDPLSVLGIPPKSSRDGDFSKRGSEEKLNGKLKAARTSKGIPSLPYAYITQQVPTERQ